MQYKRIAEPWERMENYGIGGYYQLDKLGTSRGIYAGKGSNTMYTLCIENTRV